MQEAGKLTIIQGTMYGGKTEELYNMADTLNTHIKKKIQIYVPFNNKERDGKDMIISHRGTKFPAKNINSPNEILEYIKADLHAIFIDEAQFFEPLPLRKTVIILLRSGYDVYVCGLVSDFSGNPFKSITELIPYASKVLRKNAHCTFFVDDDSLCGGEAFFNQRLDFEGNPVTSGDKIVVDSGTEYKYEPRCFMHFVWSNELDSICLPKKNIPNGKKLIRVM